MEPSHDSAETREAALWLARRDRGLSPEEQDRYLDWITQRPGRADAVARLERTWRRLDAVGDWRPADSAPANPDVLAKRRRMWAPWVSAAAAAIVAVTVLLGPQRAPPPASDEAVRILPGPERRTLEDGSLVELDAGAAVEIAYTPDERRVRLTRGDAHFTVQKDPTRPFVVEADSYTVRAVGTAFLVGRGGTGVQVLVTEGRIRLSPASAGEEVDLWARDVRAGQVAVAPRESGPVALARVEVRDLTSSEMEAAQQWRGIRLEFEDQPLEVVVAAFNRFNARRLVVGDAETGRMRVGGRFRADHLDAFVRLLDVGFEVETHAEGADLILQRRPHGDGL